MKTNTYNWILYVIVAAILATLSVQFYWNYQNFQENKQRVENDIQISLDNAVEAYYSIESKENFLSIVPIKTMKNRDIFKKFWIKDSSKVHTGQFKINSLQITTDNPEEYKNIPRLLDSIMVKDSIVSKALMNEKLNISQEKKSFNLIRGKMVSDSLKVVKGIQSVVIALTNNNINFSRLDSLFASELTSKDIETGFYFDYYQNDSTKTSTKKDSLLTLKKSAQAKSTYLRSNQKLLVFHEDVTNNALRKSFGGILISLFLSLVIISTLFYLLKIIHKQKELAEIKNDLISNITHEFKTPIATVSTAVEAIQNFNAIEDKEKTKKYLAMSSDQLKKLNLMVEKLLETATLDSENLILNTEKTDIVGLVEKITQKYDDTEHGRSFTLTKNIDALFLNIDPFHVENSVSNLIDNAFKYGGDAIEVDIHKLLNSLQIIVADNGGGIDKSQQEKLFDKFYRIPKGNTHDVKGFGIGLYYAKKIIEKHGGSLLLKSNREQTLFTINLPYES